MLLLFLTITKVLSYVCFFPVILLLLFFFQNMFKESKKVSCIFHSETIYVFIGMVLISFTVAISSFCFNN